MPNFAALPVLQLQKAYWKNKIRVQFQDLYRCNVRGLFNFEE